MGQEMIVDRSKRLNAYAELRRASRVAPGKEGRTARSPEADTASSLRTDVSVSAEAVLFSKMKEQLRVLPEIREDRVEELRKKLLEGRYFVSPEDIAGKLTGEDSA